MHKYTITLTTKDELNPGNLDHILAVASNPSTKNVYLTHEELPHPN